MSNDNQSNTVNDNQTNAATANAATIDTTVANPAATNPGAPAFKSPANPLLPIPKVVASKSAAVGPSLASLSALNGTLTGTLNVEPDMGEAAVGRLQPLLDAITEGDVLPRLNTSARNVAITALGVHPRILAMRADAARMLPNHNLVYIDCFEDILLALLHSDTAVQMSSEDKKELAEKAVGFYAKRDKYNNLARGFAEFGQIDPAQIEVVGKEGGYKALARDLSILAKVYRQNWPKLGSSLPFSLQDVAQLDRDSLLVNTLLGAKEQSPEAPREVNVLRRRIYTLFRMAIADLRRVAIYLYGEEAVDAIIPGFSNFTKPGRGTKGEAEGDATAETDSADNSATDADATLATPASPAPQRPSGFIVNNPENLPITNPFSDDEDAKESA